MPISNSFLMDLYFWFSLSCITGSSVFKIDIGLVAFWIAIFGIAHWLACLLCFAILVQYIKEDDGVQSFISQLNSSLLFCPYVRSAEENSRKKRDGKIQKLEEDLKLPE